MPTVRREVDRLKRGLVCPHCGKKYGDSPASDLQPIDAYAEPDRLREQMGLILRLFNAAGARMEPRRVFAMLPAHVWAKLKAILKAEGSSDDDVETYRTM